MGSAGTGMIYDTALNTLFHSGGRQSFDSTNAGTVDVTNTWKYSLDDPSSGWVASTPIPYKANHQSVVMLKNALGQERHFFMGGQEKLYECCQNRADTFEFIARDETWLPRAPMLLARGHATASTKPIGCGWIIAGGSVNSPIGKLNRTTDMSYYDIPSDTWSFLGNLPFPGATPVVVIASNGYIHFVNQRPSSRRRRISS
jgi:hypothetical protein